MEADQNNKTAFPAENEAIEAKENVVESSSTEPQNSVVPVEMSLAEIAPLHGNTSAELPPVLETVKPHSVTTVEVTKDATNVDMDETLSNAAYPVYVSSLTEAEDLLHRFENDTKTRYSVWRAPKDFGNSQIDVSNKRIYWQEFDIGDKITVKSDGVPFMMMGRKVYDCHFGRDRNVRLKEKLRLQREKLLENDTSKTRKTAPTRKLDCPAKIVCCEIIYLPDFKISTNTKYYRGIVAKKIKESFADGSVNMKNVERRIYISFPTSDEHIGHPTCVQTTNMSHRVDPKVCKKLSELVLSGVRNEREMKQQLDTYINQDVYPGKAKPFHSNKRYYPTMSVLRLKMYHECVLQRLMVLDCKQVEDLATKLSNPEDKIYTRSCDGINDVLAQGTFPISMEELLEEELRVRQKFSQQQFIFVHQTPFQRHLLKRYGNHVCFLDPVYRTVKYSLPLFFVMVKTNVDYQVVATFVVQDEDKESTKEALEFIKSWNPEWKPKVFMVDNECEEIASIEESFPDCKVLLEAFHREEAWNHWLSRSSNGMVAYKNTILASLRLIAQAKSVQEFEEALEELKKKDYWQCDYGKNFRNWFEEKWLSIKEDWVYAYQKSSLCDLVMTNNTVEYQRKDFTHEQLFNKGGTLLSDILRFIIDTILPAKQNFYMKQNVVILNKDINIPTFYCGRSRGFTEHTAECMATLNEYTKDDVIVKTVLGEFLVKSPHSNVENNLNFGNDAELPYCECDDWSKTMMPCKHFMLVMRHYKDWNWSSFPERYRNSPYFTLDPISNPEVKRTEPSESSDCRPIPSESRPDNDDESNIPTDQSLYEVLLDKQSELKSTACECRDLLSKINDLTYLTQDKKVLTSLHNVLRETMMNLERSLVDDDVVSGLSSESDVKKNRVFPTKSRKRVSNCNGRESVGSKLVKVDSTRRENEGDGSDISGNLRTSGGTGDDSGCSSGIMNGDVLVSDAVSDNVEKSGNVDDMNDSNGERVDTGESSNTGAIDCEVMVSERTRDQQKTTERLNNPLQININLSSDAQNKSSGFNFLERGKEQDSGITMMYSNATGTLSKYEERVLTKQEMITVSTVNLAQCFLKKVFPQVSGLQNVAHGHIQAFEHVSGDFIQILHDGGNHWVCVSNVCLDLKDPPTVAVYDSMNQGFIAKFTKQQLASLMRIRSAEMKVIMKSVQQQTSSVDCGVFAIAFATALAFAQEPSKLRFDVSKMRAHLVECLKLKKMSSFPEMKPGSGCSDIVLSKRKFYTVELFCSCRMPYEKPKSEADLMAQCGSCKEWFHQRCERLKVTSGRKVVCKLCLKKLKTLLT